MKVEGKTVWITGASSGIGEALASALAAKGATVILSARSADKLGEIKQRLEKVSEGKFHVVPCDVTRTDSVESAAEEVKKKAGRVDILINNAGVSQRSYALDTSMKVIRDLMEVNFFGAVAVTKSILPWMIRQGGGHIVVISSMAGKFGFRMRSAYAASKHALHGFFETLRAEMHDSNVKVTMVCPGRVKTDISVHSLTGDGKLYGIMDEGQARGLAVENCAYLIVRAIEHNRKEVFIGGAELMLLFVKRTIPSLFYYIVNRASPT